ncbi:hypothetical protein ACFWNN_05920 [Lentzea sp. NPDC058450]|uniref:hypothetical protein n=1 Tax=Lentzea sp. NPDC058450 TaxID=3346505 RepID=UPI0036635F14
MIGVCDDVLVNMSTRNLRLIGYWLGPDTPGWPDVRAFVDPSPDAAQRDRTVAYLRSGTVFVAAAGMSFCRICGRANGSTELTDGVHFVWPEGLAHYVEDHNVRLPAEVTAAMTVPPPPVDIVEFMHLLGTNEVTIDDHWWHDINGR